MNNLEIIEGHVYLFGVKSVKFEALVVKIENGRVHTLRPDPLNRPLKWERTVEQVKQAVMRDITDDPAGQEVIARLKLGPVKVHQTQGKLPLLPTGGVYSGHPLSEWQTKLESNFADLIRRKSEASPNVKLPVYALEHGLDDAERIELLKTLQNTFKRRGIESNGPPLPWVVHASEVGLRFDGSQYWPIFEADFPDWQESHRDNLATLFLHFNNEYGGARPVQGPWSNHFTRICLPITHSILPRLYQEKLSACLAPLMKGSQPIKSLLDDTELLQGLMAVGKRLHATDRFNDFLDGNILIAEIVRSFFGDDERSMQIEDAAFERVVSHLEETFEQTDRRKARGSFSDAIRIKRSVETLYPAKDDPIPSAGLNGEYLVQKAKALAELAITVELRNSPGGWAAEVTVPCLEAWFSQLAGADEILNRAMLRVHGSENRSRRLRSIQRGSQTFPLQTWPEQDQPLCVVEPPPGLDPDDIRYIDRFLEFLSPDLGDLPLVFQVTSDRSRANLVPSKKIRPGETYIIIGTDDLADAEFLTSNQDQEMINVSGIGTAWLNIPENLSEIESDALRESGLKLGRSVMIGPVGMMGLSQNELTFGWLVGQSLTIGFKADFPLDAVRIWELGHPESVTVINVNSQNLVLMEVPTESRGVFVYGFAMVGNGEELENGVLGVLVRDPIISDTWLDSPRHALHVILEPAQFNHDGIKLEDLWESRILIEIRGVAEIPLDCKVRFLDNYNQPVGTEVPIKTISQTPVHPEEWNMAFKQEVRLNADAIRWYGESESIELIIEGGERGQYKKVFPRRNMLIKWKHEVVKDSGHLIYLEGDPDTAGLRVNRTDFKSPFELVPVEPNTLFQGLIPAAPGLYQAKWGDDESSAIVVPPSNKMDYGYLSSTDLIGTDHNNWSQIFDIVQGWVLAPSNGDADLDRYRGKMLEYANTNITSTLLDTDWTSTESKLRDKGKSLTAQDAEWILFLNLGVPVEIFRAASSSYEHPSVLKIQNFLAAVSGKKILSGKLLKSLEDIWKYRPYFDEDQTVRKIVAEFALRLANAPETLLTWSRGNYREAISQIGEYPKLLRSARLFCLLCNVHVWRDANRNIVEADRPNLELYKRWEWS